MSHKRKTGLYGKRIIAAVLVTLISFQLFIIHPTEAHAAVDYVIVITGTSVLMRKDAGDTSPAVRGVDTGKMYDYINEKKDSDGVVWYKIQYGLLSLGWVSSRDSEKYWAGAGELEIVPVITEIAASFGTIGMQAAVIEKGEVTETFRFGYAVNHQEKMTDDKKIRVASLSKVFTAMNIMKLAELDTVDIDADISEYWGQPLPKPVTLRSLLTHTSTIGDLSANYSKTREGTLAQITNSVHYLGGDVGSRWQYNNYGVGIAGSTAEVTMGKTLDETAHTYFLDGLGIDASFRSGSVKEHNYALPYYGTGRPALTKDGLERITVNDEPGCNSASFAGGLTISAKDYAELIAILANDGEYEGERYLLPESVAEMEKPVLTVSEHGGTFSQCMPLRYAENLYGQDRLYYHTGNAYGVLALASYNPDTKNGVVVVTTGANAVRDAQGIYAVCANITRRLYNYIDGKKVMDIRLNRAYADLDMGDKLMLSATIEPPNVREKVVWKSSDTRVAEVSDRGKVTVTGFGTAVITASAEDISAECIINSVPLISSEITGTEVYADGQSGVRVKMSVSKDGEYREAAVTGFGVIFAPADMLEGSELTVETENALIVPAKNLLTDTESGLTYAAAVTDIHESDCNTTLTVKGYITYTGDDRQEHYIYTAPKNCCLYDIAVSDYIRYCASPHPSPLENEYAQRFENLLGISNGKASSNPDATTSLAVSKTENTAMWQESWNTGEE